MDESPLISITIPAYQRTSYLKRLLDSIEIQTFRDFEVIITDDSPGTEVRELISNHGLCASIRYFKNPKSLGSPENWNEGIRHAHGKWIKIMHDDDWFAGKESLGVFAEAVLHGKKNFYFSTFTNVYPDSHSKKIQLNGIHLNAIQKLPETLMAANRIGPPSVVIFKKDQELEFDKRMQWLVDIDFYIRYLKKHGGVVYIPDNLIQIGISESQITQRSFGKAEVEIPERFLLFEKTDPAALQNLVVFDSWWRFIRNMNIQSEKDIHENSLSMKIPEFIHSIIRLQKKIPRSILQIGVLSKFLMGIEYLRFLSVSKGKHL